MAGWIQMAALLGAAGVALGALVSGLAVPALRGLDRVEPARRFRLLAALGLIPLAVGVAAVAVVFLPSALDALGVARDHCHHHDHHDFHLCFVHDTPPATSAVILGGAGLGLLWLAIGWSRDLAGLVRARRWTARLERVARWDGALGGWLLASDAPLAVAAGLVRPRVFVSEGLRDRLTAAQLRAVVAHEAAHAGRRDGLIKLAVRLGSRLHLPGVRRRLLDALDVAGEQACDEAAARRVGDRLTVAEAIVQARRAVVEPPPAAVPAFGGGAVERRVQGLVDGRWTVPARWPAWLLGAAVLTILAIGHDALHHLAETWVARLF
ncbi:MAG: M48 family metalloprotease [Myxococcota bacterium]